MIRIAPDDCDWNGHMSNSSYATNLDPVRMRVCAEWFPAFFTDGGRIALAGMTSLFFSALRDDADKEVWIGAHYHYIREIPVGTAYEIRMSVGGWEKKWVSTKYQHQLRPDLPELMIHQGLPSCQICYLSNSNPRPTNWDHHS
jgi:hypothetical protein